MPCPTCNQTMHGVGHTYDIRAILAALFPDGKALCPFTPTEAYVELEKVQEPIMRHFWCPNCGTVRTVTKTNNPACILGDEFNSDQSPRLVERVKAADDGSSGAWIVSVTGGQPHHFRRIEYGPWNDVRRCIGREKP